MRRWLIGAAAAVLAGCASASPPPGGAEDHAPPQLVRVTPDTNAVNVTAKVVTFWFDETINDRGSGATELSNFFIVSPSDGNTNVSWHRSRIDVRPRLGFRPNTAYTVTLLPGLADLRNNVMTKGGSVVFSTGPTIPTLRFTGTVFDWANERPAVRALVQAVTADSIIYLAQTDSSGHFTLGPLPEGTFLVRGIIDANNNRALDRNEAFDSIRVVTPHAAPLELLAIVRDTLAPHITTVTVADSMSLRVTFDRPLAPQTIPAPTAFHLARADSTTIGVTTVLTPRQEAAALKARNEARADSVRRADSVAGRPPLAAPVPAPSPRGAASRVSAVTPATPSVPAPPTSLLLRLATVLQPSTTYRLSVTDAGALSGRSATSERSFTTPKPPAPADTTRRGRAPRTPSTVPVTAPPTAPPVSPAATTRPPGPAVRR